MKNVARSHGASYPIRAALKLSLVLAVTSATFAVGLTLISDAPSSAASLATPTVAFGGSGAALVSFAADGVASTYLVTSTPGGFTCTVNNTKIPPTGSQYCTVSGLTNGTPYTFTVTPSGNSTSSSVSYASAAYVAVPRNNCVDVLQFGLVEVFGNTSSNPEFTLCPNGTGGYVPSAGVEINGIVLPAGLVGTLVITPAGNGGTIAIDGQKIINSVAKGPLAGTLATLATPSSLTLTVHPDTGAATQNQQQALTTQSGSGSIGGFAISGNLTLSFTLSPATNGTKVYGSALGLTVKLPSVFHKTNGTAAQGTVVISAANENSDGSPNTASLRLAGAQIAIGTAPTGSSLPTGTSGGIWLGPVQLTYLCLSYTGIVGGVPSCADTNPANTGATFVNLLQATQNCSPPPQGDSWDGQFEIKLPGIGSGLQIDAVAGTLAGKFHYAAAYAGGLNVPLYPSVALNQIGFGVCLLPNTVPWGGGFKLDGLIGLKIANVIGGSILLEYQTTGNKVLSAKINHVAPGSPSFDSQKTKWYVDAQGALTMPGSGGSAGASLAGAEIYVDPNAIGLTGTFGGSWTASGSVGNLSGSAAASISAAVSGQVSLTNNAFNIFATVAASASGSFSLATSVAGFNATLGASASASGNGTLAISDFGFGTCLNLSGSASGHVKVTHYVGFPFYSQVTLVNANISRNFNFGLGAADGFVAQGTAGVPAGYQSGWRFFWGACDAAHYEDINLVGHSLAMARSDRVLKPASTDVIRVTVAKGQRGQLISVIGKNGPPQITITAPDGEKLATPHDAKGRPALSPHMMIFTNTASNQTFIALGKPPAGTYTIALKPGSTPIIGARKADILPEPQVKAYITAGSGRTRFLHYSIRSVRGQSVQFFEMGAGDKGSGGFAALGPVQGVTRSGVIRFSAANGLRELRLIRALISENGLPRTELNVATYSAPGPSVSKNVG